MNFLSRPAARITDWKAFRRATRSMNGGFLAKLDQFPNSILVAGCQRSGTTMLANIITNSEGMTQYYWLGPDGELDAALLLGGFVDHAPSGRYCFQTTYINRCYHEYYEHPDHKIIWVVRNPLSVVYSMLHNWHDHSLNELFRECGSPLLTGSQRRRYQIFGKNGVNRLTRACLSYTGKVSQVNDLAQHLGPDQIMVIDYDDLVMNKEKILPELYRFIDLEYKPAYADKINAKSVNKAKDLSEREVTIIESLCRPTYMEVKQLANRAKN